MCDLPREAPQTSWVWKAGPCMASHPSERSAGARAKISVFVGLAVQSFGPRVTRVMRVIGFIRVAGV